MEYDNLIQKAFDLLKESKGESIPINRVSKHDKDSRGNVISTHQILERKALDKCGLFICTYDEKHTIGYIELSDVGWKAALNFNWRYQDYLYSLKPSTHYSTWIAIGISIAIFIYQIYIDVNSDKLEEQIIQLEKWQELELKDSSFVNFCHSCEGR